MKVRILKSRTKAWAYIIFCPAFPKGIRHWIWILNLSRMQSDRVDNESDEVNTSMVFNCLHCIFFAYNIQRDTIMRKNAYKSFYINT